MSRRGWRHLVGRVLFCGPAGGERRVYNARPALRGWVVSLIVVACGCVVATQRGGFGGARDEEYTPDGSDNQPYAGQFQFVRLRYEYGLSGFGLAGRLAPWAHDYPRADAHFTKILSELSLLRTRPGGSNVFSLDDPDLLSYPFAYMSEPGFWRPSEAEIQGLRQYLLKGGFLVFDDFRATDWDNLQIQMRRVLPEWEFKPLDGTHPVFHSFFEIPDPLILDPPYGGLPPSYWGLFEDNREERRLVAVANVNNDLGEYWEFSDTGFMPVDLSNEAYKFGVNYAMYALTH